MPKTKQRRKVASDNGVRNLIDDVLAFETGELSGVDTIAFFQRLINSGQAWHLQGSYGRTASDLIEQGFCTVGSKPIRDYYGNSVPSTEQLEAGTKGTIEYCRDNQPDYWDGRNDDHSLATK